ncbi:repetitive organellar protein isoform X2 [Aethina tumida]|uniref:repetitive organellar protein isoform X2 n=1 Tax=Aethina tumida TaxID=116153 RepID=UPI002148D5A9|nr:repetitive organellar protein isoform X2 [Aethina tumida]
MTNQWETILVEWVNCLNLSKTIESIEELKDVDFFNNIQKILKKSDEFDVLTFIFDIFSKYYPKFSFKNKSNLHISDLSKSEVSSITSLLMHYTCIYDRRDVLTVPLCNTLDQKTQIHIRNFLEKVTSNITYEELQRHMQSNYDENALDTSDILKTPSFKAGRLQVKDREISKLKSELELERYEKADLQEEIKLQIEKNKKLDKQLEQKKSEISRLRAEVLSLESRTPPHYQDRDSREIQKQLRSEIQSLEQYIHQCDEEHEQLRKEKDAAKEKVRKLELQVTQWQEKFFLTENNFQKLSEQSREQQTQLENLQLHCSELEGLLDEIRSKPLNESLLDDNYLNRSLGLTPSCEDLAHSVVDVQLRDVQKQNEDLKNVLKESQETASKLHVQMEKLSIKLHETNNRCSELAQEKELFILKISEQEKCIQEKIAELNCSQNDCTLLKEQISKALSEVSDLKENLDILTITKNKLEIEQKNLQELVDELRTNQKISEANILKLNNDNRKLETSKSDLENHLKSSQKDCEIFKTEIQELKEQLSVSVAEIASKNENLDILNCTKTKLEKDQENLKKLIDELNDKQKSSEDNILKLKEDILRLEFVKSDLEKQLESSQTECETFKTEIHELKEQLSISAAEIVSKNEDLDNLNNTKAKLEKDHKNLQQLIDELNDKQKSSEDDILKLNDDILKLEFVKTDLEKQLESSQTDCETFKTEIQELKEQLSVSVAEIASKTENLDILNNTKTKLEKEQENLQKLINELNHKQKASEDNIVKLSDDILKLEYIKSDLENHLKSSQKDCETFKTEIQELKEQLSLSQTEIASKNEDLNILTNTKTKLEKEQENLQKLFDELNAKQTSSEDTILKLNDNIVKLETSKSDLEKELSLSQTNCETIKTDLSVSLSEMTKLKENLDILSHDKVLLEKEQETLNEKIVELKAEQQSSNDTILKLTDDYQKLKVIKSDLEKHFNSSQENCETLKVEVSQLKERISETSSEIARLKDNLEILGNSKTSLEKEYEDLQKINNEMISKQKSSDNTIIKLNDDVLKLETSKSDFEKQLKNSQEEYKMLESNILELKRQHSKSLSEVTCLKEEVLKLKKEKESFIETIAESLNCELEKQLNDNQKYCATFKVKISELNENLTTTKNNLQESNNKISNLKQEITISKTEIENLQGVVNNKQREIDNLNDKLASFENDVKNLQLLNNNKQREIDNFVDKATKTTEEIENLRTSIKKKEDEVDQKEEYIKSLESDLNELKLKDSSSISVINNLEIVVNNLKSENSEFKNIIHGNNEKIINTAKQVEEQQQECSAFQSTIASLKSQLEESEKNISIAKENIKLKDIDLSNNKEIIANCQNIIDQNNDKIRELVQLNENYRNELDSIKVQLQNCYDTLHKKDMRVEELMTENEELKQNKEILNKEIEKLTMVKEELTKSCFSYKEYWELEVEQVKKIQKDLKNINTHLEEEKNVFLETVLQKDNQISELETTISKLTKQKDNLLTEISQAKETIDIVQSDLQNDNSLLNQYKERTMKILNTVQELYGNLNSDEQVENDLIQQLTTIENQVVKIKKENTKLQEDYNKVRESESALIAKSNVLEDNIMRIKSAVTATNDDLHNLIASVKEKITLETSDELTTDSNNEVEILCKYVRELKGYISSFLTSEELYMIEIEGLKEDLDAALNKCSDELQEKRELKMESESQITDLTRNLHEIIEKYNKLELEYKTVKNKLEECENQMQAKAELVQESNQLKEQLNAQETKNRELTEENEKLKATVQEQEEQLAKIKCDFEELNIKLTKDIKDRDNEIIVLKQTIGNLEIIIQQKNLEILKLQTQIEESKRHIDLLTTQNSSLNTLLNGNKDQHVKDAQKRKSEYEIIISEHKSAFDNLKTVNDKLMLSLTQAKSELNTANSLIESTRKEKHDLEDIIKETNEVLEDTIKEKKQLQEEFEAVQVNLTEKDHLLTELRNELDETYQKISDLKGIREELNVQLEVSRKETQEAIKLKDELLESQSNYMKEIEVNAAHKTSLEIGELRKRNEMLEKERAAEKDIRKRLEIEVQRVRQAYGNVMTANSSLELENSKLRTSVKDKKEEIGNYMHIKEAYEKLLEENNKLLTDVDTLKYKRLREKEDIKDVLNKDREETERRHEKRIQDIRMEYEGKLEKMKEKMLKLYKDEQTKAKAVLESQMSKVQSELAAAEQKIHLLETERDMLREREVQRSLHSSRESLSQRSSVSGQNRYSSTSSLRSRPHQTTSSSSIAQRDKKQPSTTSLSSLRGGIRENKVSPDSGRVSIASLPIGIGQSLRMEDEEEAMFNNKYLSDLKEGRGFLTGRESTSSRLSTLAMRNSMVPPHLKSSYPAETQFVSPSHYKDDEIKTGNVDLDDSLSKLLPGEKHDKRQRKDIGTTTYKKPGPPTPSKNGGRLSLQGNEVHPLRESNDKTPLKKVTTPGRLKSLFSSKNVTSSLRENSENTVTPSRTKRRSIFRKPK